MIKNSILLCTYNEARYIENTVLNLDEALDKSDYIILVTDHDEFYEKLTSEYLKNKEILGVIDGRNCLNSKSIKESNIFYKGIGKL